MTRGGYRPSTRTLGDAAESAVAEELVRRGCSLLARKYRFRRLGEIDLIAAEKGAVVFVEVKARTSSRFGTPAESVTPDKVRRIRQVAACFLQERGLKDCEVRFLAASVQCEYDGRVSCMEFLPFE